MQLSAVQRHSKNKPPFSPPPFLNQKQLQRSLVAKVCMTVAEVGEVICREGVYKIPTVLLTSSFVCGTVLDILAFNLPALAISAFFFFFF